MTNNMRLFIRPLMLKLESALFIEFELVSVVILCSFEAMFFRGRLQLVTTERCLNLYFTPPKA